jgi:hypothetical protein
LPTPPTLPLLSPFCFSFRRLLVGATLEAVMGNVGATIVFQCGLEDGRALAPYMKPGFSAEDLLNLDKFETAVKMRLEDQTQPAFSLGTLTLEPLRKRPEAEEREQRVRQKSIAQYTPKTRAEVMAWLAARYPRPGGYPAPGTDDDEAYYDRS